MFKHLIPYAAIFLIIETITRLTLLTRVSHEVGINLADTIRSISIGLWFDFVTLSFFLLPIAIIYLFIPAKWQGKNTGKTPDFILRMMFNSALISSSIAEHLFWTEFSSRFNFIAVDYLVYTNEVIGNVMESYPVYWMLFAVITAAVIITYTSYYFFPLAGTKGNFFVRLRTFAVLLVFCTLMYSFSDLETTQFSDNTEVEEVSANGIYNLFYAFKNNEISYNKFYKTEPKSEVAIKTHHLFSEENLNFVSNAPDELIRTVQNKSAELNKNVILVVMESMSASYMGAFGNTQNLTPNLDNLAQNGLFFTKTYATGTRTVRGLEAITLSLPPTPGQSIIRRPGNENLFSIGFIFKDRGYDTKFIYGGYGYFDNMNDFFSNNGFDVIDRSSFNNDEVHFANIWGIADDDVFAHVIKEADISYNNKKPFMHLVMTTSNHRPYTYPEGKIDIAPKTGRFGGVKYADYSIGELIESAKQKPWFKDTIFVFVADHTAGAGGKTELNPEKYHIPMIFYSPNFIKTSRYEKISSQIDLAPILLGQLNFSYYTKFYGEDLLHDNDEIPHAFISNYQKVALVKEGEVTVLSPKKHVSQFNWMDNNPIENKNEELVEEAISYYQSASWWREKYKRIPTILGSQPLK